MRDRPLASCSGVVLAIVLRGSMQALALTRAPQHHRGLDVETVLEFDAEKTQGTIAAGPGDPGHVVS